MDSVWEEEVGGDREMKSVYSQCNSKRDYILELILFFLSSFFSFLSSLVLLKIGEVIQLLG